MAKAIAHPNIALIKYWGKADVDKNIPATPSLSITLDKLTTETEVTPSDLDIFLLNGKEADDQKIADYLEKLRHSFDIPPIKIRTENNFPTAAGLASSASGFAALITAINAQFNLRLDPPALSTWARIGSGSAPRSLLGGVVTLEDPDWQAVQLLEKDAWDLSVVIAITEVAPKKVSSSLGMQVSAATSTFYDAWVKTAPMDLAMAKLAMEARDFEALATASEQSCLKMHAVMLASSPGLIYWNGATANCLHQVRQLRAQGVPVFFTVDAGPQVKAVCLTECATTVADALSAVADVKSVVTTGLGNGARVVHS